MTRLVYFAYGSNMSLAQMRQRCPLSRAIGPALLSDHRLCFPRHSPRRNCGAASIAPLPGSDVWGVLYDLAAADLAELDRCEGCLPGAPRDDNRYNRAAITVQAGGAAVDCFTYIANPQPGQHLPSRHYLATIVTGAAENGLPADYIAALRRQPINDG